MKKQLLLIVTFFLIYTVSQAQVIDLTSGGAGVATAVPQSYNETRGVDVTVLATPVNITSMTLHRFCTGGANDSGFVGARIYNSATQALLFSHDTVVHPMYNDSVKIPVSYTLSAGQSYRISFSCYGYGNNNNSGSGFMYQPTFPYNESGNLLQVNSAHAGTVNTFPNNVNIFVPFITLKYKNAAPAGTNDFNNTSLYIAPNPFSSLATLQSDELLQNATLVFYNVYGQKVKKLNNLSGSAVSLQRDNLPAGIYFLQLIQDNKLLTTGKIIAAD